MSILIERASFEDRAKFFHKNRFAMARLLGDLAEPAEKPKKKKKAKAKAKPKAKTKVKAKAKPEAKVKAKPKEAPKVEEKDLSIEVIVTDNIVDMPVQEVLVQEIPVEEVPVEETPSIEASVPTDTPDDLTKIKGLGAKIVERLNTAGVTTFDKLANLTTEEIADLGKSIRGFAASYESKGFKKQAQEFNK